MAQIDTNYYTCAGPAQNYDNEYDNRVCDLAQLFGAYQSSIVDQNQFAAQNGGPDANTIANMIQTGISIIAAQTGVSDSLLLAVIIRESSGNTRASTTTDADGTPTGGLMQCSGDAGFDPIQAGFHTLTQDDITGMISIGAQHLLGNLQEANFDFWSATRLYNSGSIDPSANLDVVPIDPTSGQPAGVSTYPADIGNILHGCDNLPSP